MPWGLGAAIDYVDRIGLEKYRVGMCTGSSPMQRSVYWRFPGSRIIGTASKRRACFRSCIKNVPSEEVGARLIRMASRTCSGITAHSPSCAVRVEATVRPSFAFYNTCAEIDVLIDALWRIASERGV